MIPETVYYCNQKLHRLNQPAGWDRKILSGQNYRPHCIEAQKNSLVLELIVLFLKCDTVLFER